MTKHLWRRAKLGAACVVVVSGALALVTGAGSANKPLAGKRIGLSACCPGATTNFQLAAIRGEMKLFNEGETLNVVFANLDAATQLTQTSSFIGQKFNAIMTSTYNGAGYAALAAQAHKQNPPIVFTNLSGTLVNGGDLNIILPNYQGGYESGVAAGQWLKKYFNGVGQGGVSTIPGNIAAQLRTQGFINGVHSVVPGAKVWVEVAQEPTALEQGSSAVSALLGAHPDIKMLFGATELFSVGMVQAAKERGITDPHKLFISAPDGSPSACFGEITKGTPFQMCAAVSFGQASAIWARLTELKLLGVAIPKTGLINAVAVTSANVKAVTAEEANPLELKYRQALLDSVLLYTQGTNVWTDTHTPSAKTPSVNTQFWTKNPWPKRSA